MVKGSVMILKLLLILAILSIRPYPTASAFLSGENIKNDNKGSFIISLASQDYPIASHLSQYTIRQMLHKEGLSTPAVNKVLTTLKCAKEYNVDHNNILTVIDYSLPSNEKRLWVFDLIEKKPLFHTYVSHGIKSGQRLSHYFSNRHNSKASSIGVYHTENAYYGRHGLSLKLDGLEKDFNDHAFNRFIVMHGGWYVREDFIKKYGRPGRSWGCPVVPKDLTRPIIDTIKDKSLFVAYYPSQEWFFKSRFLNCDDFSPRENANARTIQTTAPDDERKDILFVDTNKNNIREENEPIVVMRADNYRRIFHATPPLTRMLRRQINHTEYIALSGAEFKSMDMNMDLVFNHEDKEGVEVIDFVIPEVKLLRGYYATEMKKVDLGKVKEIRFDALEAPSIHLDSGSQVNLKSSKRFIRWLGL